MNAKTAIENRRNSFFTAYNITDKNILADIDNLFAKINDFGATCTDYMDFETKFASSPLNTEYINLFTKIATTCEPKLTSAADSSTETKSDAQILTEEALDDVRFAAKSAASPLRHQAYEESTKILRSTKLGNALFDAKNHAETINHLRKLGKKDKE